MKHPVQLLLCVLLFGTGASAQNYNANLLPLGEREALMGNTGTAGESSPAAIYYNPAALTELEGASISLTGSTFLFTEIDVDPVVVRSGMALNFEAFSSRSFSASSIAALRWGKWSLAGAILQPLQQQFENKVSWTVETADGAGLINFQQSQLQEDLWVGGALARPLSDRFSIGGSCFIVYHEELLTRSEIGVLLAPSNVFIANSFRLHSRVFNVLMVVGAHYRSRRVRAGIRLQPASIRLLGRGDYFNLHNVPPGDPAGGPSSLLDVKDLSARYSQPWEVRLGLGLDAVPAIRLAMDLSYRFSRDYWLFDHPAVIIERRSRGRARINAGAAWQITSRLRLLGGAYFNPATGPLLPSEVADRQQDYFGATFGGEYSRTNIRTTLGMFMNRGDGKGIPPGDSTIIADLNTRNLGFMFTTMFYFGEDE